MPSSAIQCCGRGFTSLTTWHPRRSQRPRPVATSTLWSCTLLEPLPTPILESRTTNVSSQPWKRWRSWEFCSWSMVNQQINPWTSSIVKRTFMTKLCQWTLVCDPTNSKITGWFDLGNLFDLSHAVSVEFLSATVLRILARCPNLRVVCEHITTAAVACFVEKAPGLESGNRSGRSELIF